MSSIGKRLLLIDDDEQLVGLLVMRLERAGYAVTAITRPEEGYRTAVSGGYDAIVLDVIMPRVSGFEMCARLRERGVLTPILLLSGQSEKDTIVRGLNAGADDYLTKPFHEAELIARIRALLRRQKKSFHTTALESCGVTLDMVASVAIIDDMRILLTPKEVLLLKRLMAEAPHPVSRLALLQDVWGIGAGHSSNRLDVYIRRLRQKLRQPKNEDYIHTVRNGGYYFGLQSPELHA